MPQHSFTPDPVSHPQVNSGHAIVGFALDELELLDDEDELEEELLSLLLLELEDELELLSLLDELLELDEELLLLDELENELDELDCDAGSVLLLELDELELEILLEEYFSIGIGSTSGVTIHSSPNVSAKTTGADSLLLELTEGCDPILDELLLELDEELLELLSLLEL